MHAHSHGDGDGDGHDHNHDHATEEDGDDTDDLLAMKVSVDGAVATVDLISMKVSSESDELRERVEAVLEMALTTMTPLSRLYAGQGLEDVEGEVLV